VLESETIPLLVSVEMVLTFSFRFHFLFHSLFFCLDAELFESNVKTSTCAETLSAFTTIELSVPENIIGGILGPQGSTLHEITTLSGAKITVAKRGDYIEGTNNRLVTITGSPPCSQTAHTLIIHKLRQAMETAY
jgi:hypothetical protein